LGSERWYLYYFREEITMDSIVLASGNINVDCTVVVDEIPETGEVEVLDFYIGGGGSAANYAVALAKLGVAVRFLGCIGDDLLSNIALKDLRTYCVDLSFVRRVHGERTGLVIVVVRKRRGDKVMFAYRGANRYEPEVPLDRALVGVVHVHAAGTKVKYFHELFKVATERGCTTSYDPGPVACSKGLSFLDPVLRYTKYLFIGADELMNLVGCSDVESAARKLIANYPQIVVVARIGKGEVAEYWRDMGQIRCVKVSIPPVLHVVDPTGAGDVFDAAYTYGLLRRYSTESRLYLALAAASIKIQRKGARAGPVLDELLKYLSDLGIELSGE